MSAQASPDDTQALSWLIGDKTRHSILIINKNKFYEHRLAEGAGFEPAIRFPAYTLSRRAPSATRPPLRSMRRGARDPFRGDARLQRAVRLQPLGHPSAACARAHADVVASLNARERDATNRTCAGHKPSRPSRQAAKRWLVRSMSITLQTA